MARPEQIIQIEPQTELKFRGPFNVPVTSYMKLINPTDKTVIFKIKTTAPKKYCVRPNSGVLEPKNIVEIAICLQPFIFDPAEKNKHKFMVQTVVAPEGDFNPDEMWKDVSVDKLMDSKLKCVFEMPVAEGGPTPITLTEHENIEEKAKRVQEVKASPKGAGAATVNPTEGELLKAAQEVKLLREEESNLRQENLQLKEEIIRLKLNSGAMARETATKYTPVATPAPMSVVHIMIAVGLALVGIIFGKFIL